jgi:erythromycin esterase-like protein
MLRSFRGPIALLDELAAPLHGPGILPDYDPVMEVVGDARIVLLGEATHGSHEFYRARARISERLIRERGFSAIAVEADWPDAYEVNRYVRGIGAATAHDALDGFRRFPQWMWRNADVVELIHFLSDYNRERQAAEQIGFYGLDVYSLHRSMAAVIEFLAKVDPHAARAARERYACFDVFGEDMQAYGQLAALGVNRSCEDEAVAVLARVRAAAAESLAAGARGQRGVAVPPRAARSIHPRSAERAAGGGTARTSARARDRRDLSAAHRARQPLLPDRLAAAVRRRDSFRSRARRYAARAQGGAGRCRRARDSPERNLTPPNPRSSRCK